MDTLPHSKRSHLFIYNFQLLTGLITCSSLFNIWYFKHQENKYVTWTKIIFFALFHKSRESCIKQTQGTSTSIKLPFQTLVFVQTLWYGWKRRWSSFWKLWTKFQPRKFQRTGYYSKNQVRKFSYYNLISLNINSFLKCVAFEQLYYDGFSSFHPGPNGSICFCWATTVSIRPTCPTPDDEIHIPKWTIL